MLAKRNILTNAKGTKKDLGTRLKPSITAQVWRVLYPIVPVPVCIQYSLALSIGVDFVTTPTRFAILTNASGLVKRFG